METLFLGPGIFLNTTTIIEFPTTIFIIILLKRYLLVSYMSKEEYDLVCTELLVTQQQKVCITGVLESTERTLCAARRLIRKQEEQLREANLRIDDLNWQIEGTYHPTPKYLNPIPFNIIVGDVERSIVAICRTLNNRIARSSQYHHFHHYHNLPPS